MFKFGSSSVTIAGGKAAALPRTVQLSDEEAEETQATLDLLPIPAAVVRRCDDDLVLIAINRLFRLAGLGTIGDRSLLLDALDERVRGYLASDRVEERFQWQTSEDIDCRHYAVMLSRRPRDRVANQCVVTLVDHTAEQRTENSLRREMLTDALTGLPNRAGFADQLEAACAESGTEAFAVLVVDLDRFSRVNACMGSLAGDELLISVARRIKGALRGNDILSRIGGDEFAVLMSLEEGAEDACQVARRIESALATPFRLSDFEIRMQVSIGIALGADVDADNEDLIRNAQFAVKRAKSSGKIEIYQVRAFDLMRSQFSIETELRRAIEHGQMHLCFQPICDLGTGRIVAFESLARWTTDTGLELSSGEFIPVAEESGLILPLGRWALAETARTLSSWDAQAGGNCGVTLSVNISAIQLQRDNVAALVRDTVANYGIAPNRLTLELTESAIVADPDRSANTLRALKDIGVTIAMDDFGTGYSNLGYLQKMPIDILKIDRSFVTGMLADRDKVAIVRAILSLAQALGMRTTAEGVETVELEQTLAALGCTFGQGFLYSRPAKSDLAFQLIGLRNN